MYTAIVIRVHVRQRFVVYALLKDNKLKRRDDALSGEVVASKQIKVRVSGERE